MFIFVIDLMKEERIPEWEEFLGGVDAKDLL